jgi:hypothetical protein
LGAVKALGPSGLVLLIWTFHQGNGTARIFANDGSVYTLSLHGEKNLPFTKEQSDAIGLWQTVQAMNTTWPVWKRLWLLQNPAGPIGCFM